MKQTSVSSAWRVSILTGEVFGGHCDYCNALLSADAISQNFYQEHRGHIPAISAWMRITRPQEYRGMELKLRVELFVGRDRPFLENPLHLPCIVLRFSCKLCQIQSFPVTQEDIQAFCSRHSRHIQAVRLHTVVQNFGGRAVQQHIPLLGHQDPLSLNRTGARMPSAFARDRAAQLSELCKPLHCTLMSMRCNGCKCRHLLKNQADIENELPLHQDHWNSVHIHVLAEQPQNFAGRELELPAYPFPLASLVAPHGLTIHCVLLELSRQHGGPRITPWNASEVARYIQAPEGRRNQPRFVALVRGCGQRAFQCEFPVLHVHSGSHSFPQITALEESFLNAAMEEA
jgi:hypothetical protein